MAFVDAIHIQLTEREKLAAVLAHLENAASEDRDETEPMGAWLKRRLAQVDALTNPHALALSARSDKVDFEESGETAENTYFYPSFRELQLWRDYPEEGVSRSQTPFEWAVDSGLLKQRTTQAEGTDDEA